MLNNSNGNGYISSGILTDYEWFFSCIIKFKISANDNKIRRGDYYFIIFMR